MSQYGNAIALDGFVSEQASNPDGVADSITLSGTKTAYKFEVQVDGDITFKLGNCHLFALEIAEGQPKVARNYNVVAAYVDGDNTTVLKELEDIKHLNPVFINDTIYVRTKVLSKRESKSKNDRGIVPASILIDKNRNYHSFSAFLSRLSISILVSLHSFGCSFAALNMIFTSSPDPIGSMDFNMDSGKTKCVPRS